MAMQHLDEPMSQEQGRPAVKRQESGKRLEFWLDTCREATERHQATEEILEYYRLHGCRFALPSSQQVEEVLSALDAAMPQWEQTHPELFFQTLELNFPELLRHG